MGSNSNSPTSDPDETKGAFHKPSNEAGSRKYRRRSSASPSASPDESPKQDLRSSPALLKEDKRRKHSTRDDRVSGRGDHELDSDSRRYSSKGYNRSSDHTRGGKDVDKEDKSYSRISSRSGRESRGGDYNRSRDYYHHKDKYNRDRSDTTERASRVKYGDRDRRGRDRDYRDEKRDYGRSSRDYKSDHITSREESRRNQDDTISRREINSQKEADKNDSKAEVRSKLLNEENKKYDEGDCKESRGRFQDDAPANKNEEYALKRPKLSGFDSHDPTRGSDKGQHLLVKDTPGQPVVNIPGSAGNVDAAKVAAMKAAELVNKNLGSTGVMTADQKKKLLWGNKKTTSTEESIHRWDSAIFPDRERQEKFNKLMGVKGEVKLAQDPSSDPIQTDKQRELQMDLEKQYTAGLRRRDGRTVGLGL